MFQLQRMVGVMHMDVRGPPSHCLDGMRGGAVMPDASRADVSAHAAPSGACDGHETVRCQRASSSLRTIHSMFPDDDGLARLQRSGCGGLEQIGLQPVEIRELVVLWARHLRLQPTLVPE